MGFFSWECNGCHKSIRSAYSTKPGEEWLKEAVFVFRNGSRIMGEYGGYGGVIGFGDIPFELDFSAWHASCWVEAGEPDFTNIAMNAVDQGYFIDDPDSSEAILNRMLGPFDGDA